MPRERVTLIAPMADEIPHRIARYDILREIARGSMGVVYEGHDPFLDRPVAVKVALTLQAQHPDTAARFRKMFFNEAQTAGLLHHPNIIEVFDAGVDQESSYIVMELVRGGTTLRNFCRPDQRLPLAEAVEIIFKCAKALDYAHRQGVIHRDIKPTNILLSETREVKISDFSIAQVTQADLADTMPMGFVGSPRYMSPEQVQEDLLTAQTDLYSLGVVAYELLSGQHPFATESFSQLIHKVVNEQAPPLRESQPDLPEVLDAIVARAMHKDPERRYALGRDLAIDLSAAFSFLEQGPREVALPDRFESARRLRFFDEFPDDEIRELVGACIWQRSDAETVLIQEGAVEDWFYILVTGSVRVLKGSTLIGKLEAGACFGEMAYLNRTQRSATVIAEGPVTVMKINATSMEQATAECRLRFAEAFLRVVCERLARTTAQAAASIAT